MRERQRRELRKDMQPATPRTRDASPGSIASGCLTAAVFAAALWFFLVLRSCEGPGRYDFDHSFDVVDVDGLFVDGSSFVFTANPGDFGVGPGAFEFDGEGRYLGEGFRFLSRGELESPVSEVCLTEPIVIIWIDSDDTAAEIPAGTCLVDGGRTEVVLR